jgi:hypothetical protein
VQSWLNSAEFSGEMVGNRLSSSQNLFLPDGRANTALFREEQEKSIVRKKKSIKAQIIPSSETLNKLDTQELQLYKEFENGEISEKEFRECVHALEQKRLRCWRAYCRATGINEEAEEVYTDQEIKNAVFHGAFPNEKACFDVLCNPMNTAVFISLVLVVSVVLLIIAN